MVGRACNVQKKVQAGHGAHICNFSTKELRLEDFCGFEASLSYLVVPGQLGLQHETLSQIMKREEGKGRGREGGGRSFPLLLTLSLL